jgi:hypothetical protein
MADSKVKTATVHITDDTHRNFVEGAHNGVRFKVPVGKDVQVNEGAFTALKDSGVKMNVIEPLPGEAVDEGSSAASTLEGTATRLLAPGEGDDGNAGREVAELSQRPDARTDEQKSELQLANVSDPKQGAKGDSAGARGLPVDTSAAKEPAKAATATKAPAKRAPAKRKR